MHIAERKDKKGNLISYRFFYSGKDNHTGKNKLYTHTWEIPQNLTKTEINKERKKAEIDFERECEQKSNGSFITENYITFNEFANEWCEEILIHNNESYAYFDRAKYAIKILSERFGKCLLRQITPNMIQTFYNWLMTRTYTKQVVVVKKSIMELIREKNLTITKEAQQCGLDRLTLRLAGKIGQKVSLITARIIAKHFNIQLANYFEVTKQETKYSKSSNAGIRTILVVIMGEAKRRGLIEHNYASREYTKAITGTTKQKEVYDEKESRQFVKALLNLDNLKNKTIFSLLIFLGLRKAEVCGLTWNDVDFNNGTISINKNCLYFPQFGIVTKATKTKNSNRTLTMPDKLAEIIQDYKKWWNNQKQMHGDLWVDKNNLFLQDSGKLMNPTTVDSILRKFEHVNGLRHIPPHSLRHTAITLQIMAGVPIKVVSSRAGHASERITLDIYTHTLKEQDKQAAETYNNLLCGNL